MPATNRIIGVGLVGLGLACVGSGIAALARSWSTIIGVGTSTLGIVSLVIAGKLLIDSADVVAIPLMSGRQSLKLVTIACATLAVGLAALWAGFHSRPLDIVPVVGGGCVLFAGYSMLLIWVRARRSTKVA